MYWKLEIDFGLNMKRKKWDYMASRVLIKNPKNGRQAWFSLPLYFGRLTHIGLTGSYDEEIQIVDYEGSAFIGYGLFSVADLEQLNRQVEG